MFSENEGDPVADGRRMTNDVYLQLHEWLPGEDSNLE
jgi:hypothetical protein